MRAATRGSVHRLVWQPRLTGPATSAFTTGSVCSAVSLDLRPAFPLLAKPALPPFAHAVFQR
jgi:hypothetical protein